MEMIMEIIEPIGTFIAMVVVFPVMMVLMFPIMGLLSLIFLNLFSWLYVGIIGLLFTLQLIAPKGVRNITGSGLSLGIILMWISLVASNKNLMNDSLGKPDATGGFPITAFEYPPGSLGGDIPPFDTWGLFYLNLVFWIIVCISIAFIFRKYSNKKILLKLFVVSIIISLYGLGYLFFKFD